MRIEDCIRKVFDFGGRASNSPVIYTPYENKTLFNKFFKLDFNQETIEIPCYCIINIFKYLENKTIEDCKYLYYNICNEYAIRLPDAKTSLPLFKDLFYNHSYAGHLTSKKVQDNIYHGGRGIITYSDYTPLVVFSIIFKKVQENGQINLRPIEYLCRINPLVYGRDDVISKYIRTKFIAGIVNVNNCDILKFLFSRSSFSPVLSKVEFFDKIKIIIDDFNSLIIDPTPPKSIDDMDNINSYLSNNVDNILNSLI